MTYYCTKKRFNLAGSSFKEILSNLRKFYFSFKEMCEIGSESPGFKAPANFYICGQTQCGKSHMVRRMLRHLGEMFHPVPTKTVYCYGAYQKEFDELPLNVELVEGFPDNLTEMTQGHEHSLVVLDDLMSQCSNDQRVADLFTKGSHHNGISVLYLTQNLFPPGKL